MLELLSDIKTYVSLEACILIDFDYTDTVVEHSRKQKNILNVFLLEWRKWELKEDNGGYVPGKMEEKGGEVCVSASSRSKIIPS